MKVEKTEVKVVCDVTGCGNLAEYKVTTRMGTHTFICADCMREMKECFEKSAEKTKGENK